MDHTQSSSFDFKNLLQYAKDFKLQKLLDRKKYNRKVYIDASDAIHILRGIYSVYAHDQSKFNKEHFNSGKTLVYAMIYKGWYNSINLLTPHSRELVTKLKLDERLFPENPFVGDKKRLTSELLYEVKLGNSLIKNNKNVREKDVRWYYENYKAKAEDLFKAVYLGLDFFWKKRYARLFIGENPIINLENESYLEGNIINSDLYTRLITIFNSERPKRKKNNHEDAVALCILNKKLEIYKDNPTENELPLFYSYSQHILHGVETCAEQSKDDEKYFTFELEDESYLNVQDTNFFLIDGIFDLEKKNKEDLSFEKFVTTLGDVCERKDIKHYLGEEETSKIQENKKKRTLLEFFKRWIYRSGIKEIHEILLNVKKEEVENNEELKRMVNGEIRELSETFKIDRDKINLIKDLWNASKSIQDILKDKYALEDTENNIKLNIHAEFTTRFSYPSDYQTKLRKYFLTLLNDIKEENNDQVDAAFLHAIMDTKYFIFDIIQEHPTSARITTTTGHKKWEDELYKITRMLSLLWLTEHYELLCKCCVEIRNRYTDIRRKALRPEQEFSYPDYRIALLHACSMMRCNEYDINKIEAIFKCIRTKDIWEENYKMWLGASFARYVLWETQSDVKTPPEMQYLSNRNNNQYCNKQLSLSGELALKAANYLDELRQNNKEDFERRLRYFYALNNYIFSISLIGDADNFRKLAAKVELLEGCKGTAFWLDRYHNTLATYYARNVLLSEVVEDIEIAVHHSDESIKSVGRLPLYITLEREIKKIEKGKEKYVAEKNVNVN